MPLFMLLYYYVMIKIVQIVFFIMRLVSAGCLLSHGCLFFFSVCASCQRIVGWRQNKRRSSGLHVGFVIKTRLCQAKVFVANGESHYRRHRQMLLDQKPAAATTELRVNKTAGSRAHHKQSWLYPCHLIWSERVGRNEG